MPYHIEAYKNGLEGGNCFPSPLLKHFKRSRPNERRMALAGNLDWAKWEGAVLIWELSPINPDISQGWGRQVSKFIGTVCGVTW